MIFCGACYLQTFFYKLLLKNIHVFLFSDKVRVRHNFKQFETLSNFGPDLSPDCVLILSVVLPPVVIHDQRDRQFQNRPRVFYQVARVVSVAMTRENIHYI